jgi:hypothetical protein
MRVIGVGHTYNGCCCRSARYQVTMVLKSDSPEIASQWMVT